MHQRNCITRPPAKYGPRRKRMNKARTCCSLLSIPTVARSGWSPVASSAISRRVPVRCTPSRRSASPIPGKWILGSLNVARYLPRRAPVEIQDPEFTYLRWSKMRFFSLASTKDILRYQQVHGCEPGEHEHCSRYFHAGSCPLHLAGLCFGSMWLERFSHRLRTVYTE